MKEVPQNLLEYLEHGQEEVYLEYKGDVPWTDRSKKLEIIKTIFALSNQTGGGIIIIGVKDSGEIVGLSESNYDSYKHDYIKQLLSRRGNQDLKFKVEGYKYVKDDEILKIIVIQVSEVSVFPLIYIGKDEFRNERKPAFLSNVGLRKGALYIRNKAEVGNKEIQTVDEWEEVIENSNKKFKKRAIRQYNLIKKSEENPFDKELNL